MLSQLMDGEWYELNPSDCVAALCNDERLRAKWARYHVIRDAMHKEPMRLDELLVARISDAIDDEPAYSNISSLNPEAAPVSQSQAGRAVAQEYSDADSENERQTAEVVPLVTVKKPSWINTGVAGLALAASVALVTVVSVNLVAPQRSLDKPMVAATQSTPINTAVANSSAIDRLGVYDSGDRSVLPTVDFVSNTGAFWTSTASSNRAADEVRLKKMLSQHLEQAPTSARQGLLPYSRILGYRENTR